ncbi:HlyD family efflux transporter periplasmic adaptor subunit [Candidatus Oscillochloris fontis]|uniref:HlyD family efflux transporter periplasmic adaptor subunit n=1 Tax=Candidatus Oscillochloris fontis TaxID=2496868 RepID=UPI00101B5D37|nr:HlyD family efflux transporter periplasmic adaptor subunit [Candidatus Oscillochloris fontis]
MQHRMILSVCLAGVLLTGCSNSTPVPAATPAQATAAPTVGIVEPTTEPSPTPIPRPSYTVQRGTIEDVLRFNGLVSAVQYPMSFTQDGIIEKIFVRPGQMINQGDLVAQLNIEDLQTQLTEAKLNLAQAQRTITQAAQAGQLEVRQAELLVEAAQQDLAQAKQPPSALVVAQAQTAVREAQSNLDTTKNNYSQLKNQAQADLARTVAALQAIQEQYGTAVTQLQNAKGEQAKELQTKVDDLKRQMAEAEAAVASAVINYDTARNNEVAAVSDAEAKLDLARAQLNDILKGPDQFVIAEKERAVRSAEIALAQARQRVQVDPTLTTTVESLRNQMRNIEEQIQARQLVAPISGEIVEINVSIGEPVQVGMPIITIFDESRLEIMAETSDMLTDGRTSLPQFNPRQTITITFDRYPGKSFEGAISLAPVASIELEGEVTEGTYHFVFDTQGLSFASGDMAEISILLSRRTNALYLPPEAIRISRSRSTVVVDRGGTDETLEIKTGLVTLDKVEILSGLREGEVVFGEAEE